MAAVPISGRRRRWTRRLLTGSALALALAACLAGARLVALGLPGIASGMAAKAVCSAAFIAGRDAAVLVEQDVRPASPLFAFVRVTVDAQVRAVSATFAGFAARRAAWVPGRGCVLGAAPAPFVPNRAGAADEVPWPAGDMPLPDSGWGSAVDAAALRRFDFKLHFRALTPAQRLALFAREAFGDATARRCRRTSSMRWRA